MLISKTDEVTDSLLNAIAHIPTPSLKSIIEADFSTVKGCSDLLAANGWKREREGGIFGHGARGVDVMA